VSDPLDSVFRRMFVGKNCWRYVGRRRCLGLLNDDGSDVKKCVCDPENGFKQVCIPHPVEKQICGVKVLFLLLLIDDQCLIRRLVLRPRFGCEIWSEGAIR